MTSVNIYYLFSVFVSKNTFFIYKKISLFKYKKTRTLFKTHSELLPKTVRNY